MRTGYLMATALLLICAGTASSQPRHEISLNGQWEYAAVRELTAPPGDDETKWVPCQVPGMLPGIDYARAWFRRDFEIPEQMRGLRIVLHFGGVKFNSVVRVNGVEVGGHFGGYEAFDVDITDVAIVGGANRLDLGCHDWTGVFVDNETDFSVMRQRPTRSRSVPRDKILAPIGGINEMFGPWDDVLLRAHPAAHVSDLFIKPSVREGQLVVDYTLANLTDEPVTLALGAVVEDGAATALELASRTVTIPAAGEIAATLEAPWADARRWSHEDPYLYHLRTRLTRGEQVVDEVRTRFGFREFWVDGSHYYLNGARVNLLGSSWWPPRTPQSREEIADTIRATKEANCNVFRTHTQPWREVWYEVADELGLLMIPEGAVWNDDTVYRINDPRFWDNYADHLRAMVQRDRNKASVIMYSLENEMFGSRMNDASPARQDLARMGELMHEWDPTRPIMYESDGDPNGVADVIGIHYPHEYPQYTRWPNTAYWLDEPLIGRPIFLNGAEEWLWDRSKPLYIGEFLWIPSSDPSWHTVFFGDEAYLDYHGYRHRAKAASWVMAIQAYRFYEVGGMCPWTMGEGGELQVDGNPTYAAQQYAMQHIAAYVREWDHNFHAGERVTRTADVYNDVLSPSNLVVRWELRAGDARLDGGEQALTMQPGERQETRFEVTMPDAETRREAELRISIMRAGEIVFEDAKACSVFPPTALRAPQRATIGLYDPSGATRTALARHGLGTVAVEDLAAIPVGTDVLVVGAGAWDAATATRPVIGGAATEGGLMAFVRAGGRALVLEQAEYPAGIMPTRLSTHSSTMTFAQMPEHPLLGGVAAHDLKWWRPDHIVTSPEPSRPTQGALKALVVSGSREGIAFAPLLELPRGAGTVVLSQMKLVERLGVEPVAGLLLQNALDYLAGYESEVRRTAVYCPNPRTRQFLDGIGLRGTDITDDPGRADWDAFELLVACGPLGTLPQAGAQIGALLARGGTVLAHGLTPAELPELPPLLAEDVAMVPYRGPVTRVPGADALSAFFANEDLYWLGESRSPTSSATKPRASDMTDLIFAGSIEGKDTSEYPHSVMTVAGNYSGLKDGYAALVSGDSVATLEIDVPEDGSYVIGVVAGGTPAFDTWPQGNVTVDGGGFGSFACQGSEFGTYTMSGHLTAGKHRVTIRFTNDTYAPPDHDRNLYVRSLLVAHSEDQGLTFLTTPPAAAVIRRGPGRVVIDNVNWDTTEKNTVKAARYICGLLTGLGAEFEDASATVIEAETFDHDPEMNWYRNDGVTAYLGDNGYIAGDVECARAGRYVFGIFARGTPMDGTYPIVSVEVAGDEVGQVELQSEGWRSYPLQVELAAGELDIRLSFINDENDPPEDRNLWIDKIEVRPSD